MKIGVIFVFLYIIISINASAGVTLKGTRVIFDASKFSHSAVVKNTNAYDVIVQTWVDDGDLGNQPNNAEAPIITKPSVFSLKKGESQVIELINISERNPEREKLYWLNIHEIPPVNNGDNGEEQKLTLTMQTQYKVFYRPLGYEKFDKKLLKDVIISSRCNDNTDTNDCSLTLDNKTSFHVNIAGVAIGDYIVENYPQVIKPNSLKTIPLSNNPNSDEVKLDLIGDDGFIFSVVKKIKKSN
jgi:P pilus assembly protein, chaperone PapD